MDQNSFGNRWGVILNLNCYGLQSRIMKSKVLEIFNSREFILFECNSLSDLQDSIHKIFDGKIKKIISVGGDGSIHFLINMLVHEKCNLSEYLITALPMGTGNDWVRTFKVPGNLSKWKEILEKGSVVQHHLGEVITESERKVFINILGFGFDSFVVQKLSSWNKKSYGKLIYLLGVVRYLFYYQSTSLKIEFDQTQVVEHIFTGHIGLGNYSGGGMKTVPLAQYDSGNFSLSIIKDYPKWKMISGILRLFNGTVHKHIAVDVFSVKEVKIRGQDELSLPVEADGELIGYLPIKVKILDKTINILIP